ncbi:MAG: FHA domain-containing protein [Chloroflexota bacterium]
MSQSDENNQAQKSFFSDHLLTHHPDGKSEKIPIADGQVIRVGRELDNDIVLTDPRASRYHAEVRLSGSTLEVKDLGSANGTVVGSTQIEAGAWEKVSSGQNIQFGETRLSWEKASSSQTTVMVTPPPQVPRENTTVSSTPPPVAPAQQQSTTNYAPWMIAVGALLLLLVVVGIVALLFFRGGDDTPTTTDVAVAEPTSAPAAVETTEPEPTVEEQTTPQADLDSQQTGSLPTNTPTPEGPQLAIPVISVESAEVRPILLGGLPSTDKAIYLVNVRTQNVGNAPFVLSTDNFALRTEDGQLIPEAGGSTSEDGLKRLGAIDRFDNLNLTSGGSVNESLIFELEAQVYDLELVFTAPDVSPVILGLGTVNAGQELAVALGTPIVQETPDAVAAAATPTLEPTPTPTRPPLIPAPQVVSRSALVGTLAYAVSNGATYDLYFGDVETGESRLVRGGASQPAFSPDGSRIAFHSWNNDSRGIVSMDVSGANATLLTNFIEDQLPTWTSDGQDLIILSRRSGQRASELIRIDSSTELADPTVVGEGEYPSIGANGQMVFKGWGATAFGLRTASDSLEGVETISNADEDTAPALSPDGTQVVFMSLRENNWDVYLSDIDGGNLKRLTDDPANDGIPVWSPDGNAIAFASNRGGTWAIWVMTTEGDGKSQLFTMEGSPDAFIGEDSFASRGWAEERLSWIR